MSDPPRLVLAGLGHAHLFVLEALARGGFPPVRAVLVSPGEEYGYSGMLSGVVAGAYAPEEMLLRAERIARAAGAEWVRGAVARVDARAKRLHLASGETMEFGLLSLDVGAALAGDDLPGVEEHALAVKPIREATALPAWAEAALRGAAPGTPARIVVVGGGAAGVELALCLDARLSERHGRGRHRVTIIEAGDEILAEYVPRARRIARELLEARGIECRTRTRVRAVGPREVETEGGETIPFGLLLWATGPRARAFIRQSGLPVDDGGYLRVGATLQAVGHADVFGAGDCVAIEGAPWVAKAGVYGVREGPVLARNLARRLRGEALEEYHPQRHWLSLLNTGDGRALMSYRGVGARARALWRLKDRIDRRFVARFHRLEERADE